MNFTTKGHYGFHAMIELARRQGRGPVMTREIATHYGISEKYLEQIMRLLRQAGLIESSRGSGGGFWLARDASEIRADEIIAALEGGWELRLPHPLPRKGRPSHCAVLEVWRESEEAVRRCWEAKSLADMATRQEMLDEDCGELDYSI
jgi:Rrf2 family transcriptional regulator, cysteine metabolism repressor